MISPATPAGRDGLAALRRNPARAVVALDYDGTLAPIVARPEQAVPATGAYAVLAGLAPRVGTLALVTGRPVPEVLALAGLRDLPRLVVLGQYGAQQWDGELHEDTVAPGLAAVRAELPRLLGLLGCAPWTQPRVEDKGLSLVVHVRGLPDPAGTLARLDVPVRGLAGRHGLEVHAGRLVLEIRPPGRDKRVALLSLCDPPPSALLFAGDDVGDLPAYDAVAELRDRGVAGLLVCSASPEGPAALRTRADVVVHGPAGIVRLLRQLLG